MQLQRTMGFLAAAAALLLGGIVANGCGSDFEDVDSPTLTIETSQGINVILPDDEDRPATQPAIEIRNSGSGELTVTSVQLINTPSRLQILGERGDTCTTDSDCGEGICFPETQTCAALGAPSTPYTIPSQQRRDLELVVTKGPREISCPAAPADTPQEFVNGYCGELRIETSATTSNGFIEDGNATLYFLAPLGSGQIAVNPSFLEFLGVTTNYTDTRSFTVSNEGQQVLTVRGISVEDRANLFEISPSTFPLDIEPGTAETFDITLNVGDGEVNLNFDTDLNIDSSAANVAPFIIQVSEGQGASPRIQAAPQALVFDQETTQELTIENIGEATLVVNSLNVQPTAVQSYYSFQVDGAPFESFPVPSGESKTVEVTFTRPDGDIEDAVGKLQIGHNDQASGNRTTITLLADAGNVPVGEILPASATFLAADGEIDTRQFVIRNIGAGDLEITGIDYNFSSGSQAEFVINGAVGTIAPGDFATATVEYTGANDTADNGEATFTSNTGGADLTLPIVSNMSSATVSPTITNLVQGSVQVGGIARFSSSGTMPATASNTWVLTSRPAGSTTFGYLVGTEFSFVPDVAGEYTVAMTAREGTREAQVTETITVAE